MHVPKSYQLIEHTADIGIRVEARDLKGIFKKVALAMFDIIGQKKPQAASRKPQSKKIRLRQKADNPEELFINWLNELLSLSATKEIIFKDVTIDKLDRQNLAATAIGVPVENYKVNKEIKAATYHQLKITKKPSGWQAEVIFDV